MDRRVCIAMAVLFLTSAGGCPPYTFVTTLPEKSFLEASESHCQEEWTRDGTAVSMNETVGRNGTGLYLCGGCIYYLFVSELGFTHVPDVVPANSSATLLCSIRFWPGEALITIDVGIARPDGTFLVDRMHVTPADDGDAKSAGADAELLLAKPGVWTYGCLVNISALLGELYLRGNDSLYRGIIAHVDLETPAPDKTYLSVSDTVRCVAVGFPLPTMDWTCSADIPPENWRPMAESLAFTQPGSYDCTCTAFHKIGQSVRTKIWRGVIDVLAETEDAPKSNGKRVLPGGRRDGSGDKKNSEDEKEKEEENEAPSVHTKNSASPLAIQAFRCFALVMTMTMMMAERCS